MTTWRPLTVWTVVTAGALAAGAAVPGAWHAVPTGATAGEVERVLVAACTTALAVALARIWVVTSLTVLAVLAGRPRPGGGATRRLVLLACGAAVVAGTSAPALAQGGEGRDVLVGLALPERAVATPRRLHEPQDAAQAPAAPTYVVRPGDSLWSIARDHPGGAASVDERWRSIWRANRAVVGDDPDLIVPGQALRLPTIHDTSSDGDR